MDEIDDCLVDDVPDISEVLGELVTLVVEVTESGLDTDAIVPVMDDCDDDNIV